MENVKEKKGKKLSKRSQRIEGLFFEIRAELNGIKYGYVAYPKLKELEKLVK